MSTPIKGKKLIDNMLWKFSERILAQFISLLVSIVLARILMPDAYGTIAIVTVLISFLDVFVNEGLPTALIQKQNTDNEEFSSVFYFNIILSVVLYALLYFVSPFMATFYKNDELTSLIRVMGIRVIVASVNSVQHAYVSKHMMFRKYFWSTLFGTVVSAFLGIWLAYHGAGAWALVAQYLSNTIIDTIFLWFTVKWRPEMTFSWKKVKLLVSFGWKVLFEGLAENFTQQARSLLIGKVYSPSDLAYYNKAQQFPQLFISNICTAISSVLLPAMSERQSEQGYILLLLRKSIRLASFIIFPILTGMAVVAEPFVRVILTDKWIACVPYLQIFCFTQALTVGMITRHQALLSTGRSDIYMKEHIVYRVFFLSLLVAVYKKGVMMIALSTVLGTLFMAVTVVLTSKKFNDYKYSDQLGDVLPSLAGCMAMILPVRLIFRLDISDIITLGLQILIGASVYYGVEKALKVDELELCETIIKRYLFIKKSSE